MSAVSSVHNLSSFQARQQWGNGVTGLIWTGLVRLSSQEDVTAPDIIRRRKRSAEEEERSWRRRRAGEGRWRLRSLQKLKSVSFTSLFRVFHM